MFRLDGKSAIITGAGSGIGREIARVFARQGAAVWIADVNTAAAETAAAEIAAEGGAATAHALDVTDLASARAVVASVVAAHSRLDILVNNAGIGLVGSVTETKPADFERLFRVNVHGVYHCTKASVEQMTKQDPTGGKVVNIASIAGQVAVPRRFAYGATKAAVIAMTQSTAMDYVNDNIRCSCICPGTVETPFVEGYLQRFHAHELDETRAALHARQPVGRMGTPADIAPLALYLASDEAAFVTGAAMVIDGGWTAR